MHEAVKFDFTADLTGTGTALFGFFRFLIFHPFSRGGGQLTPFAPMCGPPWNHVVSPEKEKERLQKRKVLSLERKRECVVEN